MLFLFFALLYTAASVYIVRRMWRDKSGPFESKYNRDQQTLALSLAVGVDVRGADRRSDRNAADHAGRDRPDRRRDVRCQALAAALDYEGVIATFFPVTAAIVALVYIVCRGLCRSRK
jgi:hypothetical protein